MCFRKRKIEFVDKLENQGRNSISKSKQGELESIIGKLILFLLFLAVVIFVILFATGVIDFTYSPYGE
ncbi:MAG: hypothetical protein H7641_09025 [Candidatus Heimdallarchaeota archaeon]|nr:hypothetical protein [Candidatus Heimdallarchaeota archaeon]MCK4877708.1 hypothetical protein [Candidatus Heimdallarchaeota archaeon]